MSDVVLSSGLARKITARDITPNWPAQYNESTWTGTGKIVLLAGIEKHRFSISFRPLVKETEIREARAFFYALKGIVNTFKLPYLPTPQTGGTTVVSAGGVIGTRTVTVASAASILPGMPISVGLPSGHERVFVVISKAGNVLTVEPAFSESAGAGNVVTIDNPKVRVRLTDPRFTYSDEMGRAGFSVEVVEALDTTAGGGGGSAPVNTVLPLISGVTTVGSTLSVTNGTWTNSPTGYAFQWKRGGVNIAGATGNTYALVAADMGQNITCSVTASNAFGSNTATSAAVGPVAGLPINVFGTCGESNSGGGARNNLNELPLRSGNPYYTTNALHKIWDAAGIGGAGAARRTLVFGPMEQQPGGAAYLDPAFTNTVGYAGEFSRWYGVEYPTLELDFFHEHSGGGRFSDLSSRGRLANFTPGLSGGAAAEMLTQWNAYVAALAAIGRVPNIIGWDIELGGNTISDATETTNFQANLTTFLAWLRTNIIGNATKVSISRIGELQRTSGSGWDLTRFNTIRTACANVVAAEIAAGRQAEIVDHDGFPVLPLGTDPSGVHFTAAGYQARGELLYAIHQNKPHVMRIDPTFTVTHAWRPGNLRNTIVSNAIQTALGLTGKGINPTNATASERPALIKEVAMANGYPDKRSAKGDGVDDILTHTGLASAILADGSYTIAFTFKGVAQANAAFLAEGGASINPFLGFRNSSGGNLEFLHRNDAGTTNGPTTSIAGAFNNAINVLIIQDNGVTLTPYLNGVAGTPIAYSGGARGTTTIDKISLFGLMYNGATKAQFSSVELFDVAVLDGQLADSAWRAKYRQYAQFYYEAV